MSNQRFNPNTIAAAAHQAANTTPVLDTAKIVMAEPSNLNQGRMVTAKFRGADTKTAEPDEACRKAEQQYAAALAQAEIVDSDEYALWAGMEAAEAKAKADLELAQARAEAEDEAKILKAERESIAEDAAEAQAQEDEAWRKAQPLWDRLNPCLNTREPWLAPVGNAVAKLSIECPCCSGFRIIAAFALGGLLGWLL